MTTKEQFIILVDNDLLKKSDAIILLEGDGLNRVAAVADLFHSNWADKIVFSGGIDNPQYGSFPIEKIRPKLKKYHIPESNLILEAESMHTRQQAENVIKLAIHNCWSKIIIVASHYHQYRAYLTFLKVLFEQNIKLQIINYPARTLPWFEENEWGKRYDLLEDEFKKIEQYRLLGHLASYEEAIEYQKWKEKQT